MLLTRCTRRRPVSLLVGAQRWCSSMDKIHQFWSTIQLATPSARLQRKIGGRVLLANPNKNKGLAFTKEERAKYGLDGLLPPAYRKLATQVEVNMNNLRGIPNDLHKYAYLRSVQDTNKRLFYTLLMLYTEELMPIVYTPVVGEASLHYSHLFRKTRGLFVSIDNAGNIEKLFRNWNQDGVKAIVATDGERILGLGDCGANGMAISVGKMALYSAIGGIHPDLTLPVCIDVGTNNEELLNNPHYIGLRRKRARGQEYDQFVEEFIQTVEKVYGKNCLIQFEDFGTSNAERLLRKYKSKCCTFNDDIEGTASVMLAGLLASNKVTKKKLKDHTYLFFGAGSAGLGMAENLAHYLTRQESLSHQEAIDRIWLVDMDGLVDTSRTTDDTNSRRMVFAKKARPTKNLEEIVHMVKPSVLVGASTVANSFNPAILSFMSETHRTPIIFSLSNPTSKSECTAEDAYRYTHGRCLFASGSPFDPVTFGDQCFKPSQANNVFIFPAMALAVMACKVNYIPEAAFLEASEALADQVTADQLAHGSLYPPLKQIRSVTLNVAVRLCEWFYRNELATKHPEPKDKKQYLSGIQYNPAYDSSIDCSIKT